MEETKTVAEETKPVLLAGYAEAVVTPPMGVNIPGYFSVRLSNGVITDLHVRAAAFALGRRKRSSLPSKRSGSRRAPPISSVPW